MLRPWRPSAWLVLLAAGAVDQATPAETVAVVARFGLMVTAYLAELLLPTSLNYRRGMGRAQWVAEAPYPIRSWRSTVSTLPSSFSSTSFGAQHVQIRKDRS